MTEITPGVWEVRDPNGVMQVCVVEWMDLCGTNRLCGNPVDDDEMYEVPQMLKKGWQFTRRYVPCDGEPVECWRAVDERASHWSTLLHSKESADGYAEAASADGCPVTIVRGLFVPQGEE